MTDFVVEPGTKDWRELGYTQQQRSAEIVAGLRAVTMSTPETMALSTEMGRWFAKVFVDMVGGSQDVINATAARAVCITELAMMVMKSRETPPKRIIEMASGFGARGYLLSQAFPETTVCELDLPEVVKAKKERIRELHGGSLPKNMEWIIVDLQNVSLPDLLGRGNIDLVVTEGVFPYFEHQAITQIAASVRECLSPDGVLIADVVSKQGWSNIEKQSWIATLTFHRQIGAFKGKVDSQEAAQSIFEAAGYRAVQVSSLKQMAGFVIPDHPVADVSFIVAAFKS